MPLTILLAVLAPLIGAFFTETSIGSRFTGGLISMFGSSGGLVGKSLEEVLPMIMGFADKFFDDKVKLQEFKIGLLDLVEKGKFKEFELCLQDAQNARQTYLTQVNENKKPWEVDALTITIVVIFLLYLGFLSFDVLWARDNSFRDLFTFSYQALVTAFSAVVGFWIGSFNTRSLTSALQQSQPVPTNKPSLYQRIRHPIKTSEDTVEHTVDSTYQDAEKDL